MGAAAAHGVFLCLWLALSAPAPAAACSVPVFRYALEHWQPDNYEAVVLHRDASLLASHPGLARLQSTATNSSSLNLRFKAVDLADPENAAWQRATAQLGVKKLPWLLMRGPGRKGPGPVVLSAELERTIPARLRQSPVRREIINRLRDGHSVVWLLLESDNPEANRKAAAVLRDRLAYLNSVLELPKLDPADVAGGLVSIPPAELRLHLSALSCDRSAEAEEIFVRTLLGVEPDLREFDEPMVFPVFGRGRTLPPFIGDGITAKNIDDAAIFLTGSCSCQVKEENPGADLLFAADWDAVAGRKRGRPTADAPGRPKQRELPNPLRITADSPHAGSGSTSGQPRRPGIVPLLILAAMLVFVLRRP